MIEMNAFKDHVWEKGKISDKIILVSNWISNNHGHDWGRSFWLWLIFNAYFYTCVKRSMNEHFWDISCFPYTLAEFINFSGNPLHKFTDVFRGNDSTGWGNLADTISKIFSAYFLFQMLKAFRKFAK